MILRTKPRYTRPNSGDKRVVRRFAWWPTHIEDVIIWLESYEEVQVANFTPRIMYIGKHPIPVPWGWDKKETRLRKRGIPDFLNPPPPPKR